MTITAQEFDAQAALASFGQACTVFGNGVSGSRTVYAIVDEDAQVNVSDGMQREERLLLTVLRDESNATYGGIRDPQLGLGVRLASDPTKAYSFYGERTQANPYAHTLRFVRVINFQIGGGIMPS